MKNFIKLFNFEINRFMKLYISMLIVVFIIQLSAVLLESFNYMSLVIDVTKGGRVSPEQFLQEYWSFSLANATYSLIFLAPIALSVVGLIFYMFFIWYRDWFARNTFIYRLLMLPANRMNIYFAKLATIMVTVIGMVAFQLIFIEIYKQVIKWIVPVVYRVDIPTGLIVDSTEYLNIVLPNNISDFFIAYGIGLTFVIVMFTAILFERSFKLLGSVIGLIYIGVAFGIFIAPFMIQFFFFNSMYFYPDEVFYIQTIITLVIIGVSLWVSHYLLTKKITV
ncbi:MAG TPA: hypothetical protein VFF20_10485 [Pseudogracilibacillus sp.]|nr:hypothetical protein [Pseudogracilibacillus sp.]